MKKLELTKGYAATVDNSDYDWLNQYKWCASVTKTGYVYAVRSDGKRMHRLILCVTDPSIVVDHRNHDTLDNRRENLRTCTHQNNVWNSRSQKQSRSRFKGVNYHRPGRWVASIWAHGERVYLGVYGNEEEAAVMYNLAAIKYFGHFAQLNTIT